MREKHCSQRHSMGKGPGAGMCLASFRKSKETTVMVLSEGGGADQEVGTEVMMGLGMQDLPSHGRPWLLLRVT